MQNKLVLIFITFLMAILQFNFAHSEELKTVRFCFVEWIPYSSMKNSMPTGISIDVISTATKRSGLNATFTELPWKRCVQQTITGKMDAVIDAPKYDSLISGPTSYSLFGYTIWVRSNSPLYEYSGIDMLAHRNVGIVSGYVYPEILISNEHHRLIEAKDDLSLIKMLTGKRFDFIVGDVVNTAVIVNKKKLPLRQLLPAMEVTSLYPSFHPSKLKTQKRLDAEIASMLQDGSVDAIYRKHLGFTYTKLKNSYLEK